MHFNDIGQQLRAYRMESGLKAEEIAARLGVSRAALYRYEKGEVIKLDTVKRLAELLKISPLTLLGIGIEYYSRPIGYLERLRQIEETSDQILQFFGPICYLTTSEEYDATLAQVFEENAEISGQDRAMARTAAEQVLSVLAVRKRMFIARRPSVIAILTTASLQRFIEHGIAGTLPLSEKLRRKCRDTAHREVERMIELMESEPIGLQLGLMPGGDPNGPFSILRSRERACLAVNPFPTDAPPDAQTGVAMITSADDAVMTHQRVAEGAWRDAIKGRAAAAEVRRMLEPAMA
ncbi:MAG TPA: helix-turn-helix transcriptional regulator [Acidiphilium sp.]|uniref:helix-turn-helix domain-containing protein n=1 Tax=unclassified Acidiphilium TaxID=2617493 RepID=UPI000BD4EE94|nr:MULTISPECIES: helix-turn-helix transcriptional regulator [unclassified Acidiphilium]OYV55661.1 MAG: transcriptional regulator [Acidiphilium sp. 20-67-58]HQT61431.1 helix-turn-helix transcriptional regulator [Acidiphilium sp.]HQT73527.1 helix-turn-helix transcriptional regulator [Acidiphilium sp.]HQU10172.1 helix-turn-helix transcriptional regulator [Acidiphilium sp.]